MGIDSFRDMLTFSFNKSFNKSLKVLIRLDSARLGYIRFG